jgi:hypothetical protein
VRGELRPKRDVFGSVGVNSMSFSMLLLAHLFNVTKDLNLNRTLSPKAWSLRAVTPDRAKRPQSDIALLASYRIMMNTVDAQVEKMEELNTMQDEMVELVATLELARTQATAPALTPAPSTKPQARDFPSLFSDDTSCDL